GATLATAGGRPVRLIDPEKKTLRRILPGYWERVHSVAFSPDAAFIATTIGRTARLWDARTATLVRTLVANPGRSSFTSLTAVAFSPDGKTLAGVAGEEGGGEALLWDTRDGRTLRSLSPPIGELDSLAFSPDGRFVAGAG